MKAEIIYRRNMPAQELTREQHRVVSIVTGILDNHIGPVFLADVEREVDRFLEMEGSNIEMAPIIEAISRRFGVYEGVSR